MTSRENDDGVGMAMTTARRAEAKDSVRVCVRIRPLSTKEQQGQMKPCIRIASSMDGLTVNKADQQVDGPQQMIVGKDRAFTFDHILGINCTQENVYDACVSPLVDKFIEGYNATILAYGQTGTGKTHTMTGPSLKSQENQGIIPRVINDTFQKMKENQQRIEYSLRVEYVEIYNEELRDLLHPDTPSKQIAIREDMNGNIVLAGVKSEVAQTKEDVFRYLTIGAASRATGSTLMNEQSSRSHAIFSMIMTQKNISTGECCKAKFHLVDLAGSERAKRTGAVAGRFKESVSINQGLLALGNVISALGAEDKKRNATMMNNATTTTANANANANANAAISNGAVSHVPYRDSKLTRLLQDSLGGNSKTLMIACVSPATINFEETLNTLKYANRAKNIKNRPIVNQQIEEEKQKSEEELQRMKEEIATLQSQLEQKSCPQKKEEEEEEEKEEGIEKHNRKANRIQQSEMLRLQEEVEANQTRSQERHEIIQKSKKFAIEAITNLVGMEKEIMGLGRPVHQRFNDVVQLLNTCIVAMNQDTMAKDATHRLLSSSLSCSTCKTNPAATTTVVQLQEQVIQLEKKLQNAQNDLARDEQIFEMKNTEMKRLQAVLLDAKAKNDKLIQRVEELEKSGQLWTNVSNKTSTSVAASSRRTRQESHEEEEEEEEDVPQVEEEESIVRTSQNDPREESRSSKSSRSSRGLFTKRTSSYDVEDDQVLVDDCEEDDAMESKVRIGTAPVLTRNSIHTLTKGKGNASAPALKVSTTQAAAFSYENDAHISKLEALVTSLRKQLDEKEQINNELQRGREEAMRRWQFERQSYEHRLNEAEQTLETLRTENQNLEEALSMTTASSQSHQQVKSLDQVKMIQLYDSSIDTLLKYQQAQELLKILIQEKQQAEQNKEQANRRKNAIEMQKLRQSISVRESIKDLTKSLHIIQDKMQSSTTTSSSSTTTTSIATTATTNHRTIEEIQRLTKLKERAERKLKKLKKQEAKEDFLDENAKQELGDLEELIEDLNSHITFQDAELVTAQKALQEVIPKNNQPNPIDGLVKEIIQGLGFSDSSAVTTTTAFCLIKKNLEDVCELHTKIASMKQNISHLETTIEEKNASLTQLENGLQAERKEFERRHTILQKEFDSLTNQYHQHNKTTTNNTTTAITTTTFNLRPRTTQDAMEKQDAEWQKLIIANQKKDEYIVDLEKHVVFYKSKAKQSQLQLQQLIRDSNTESNYRTSSTNQMNEEETLEKMGHMEKRIHQLEEMNDGLLKDLANAKLYLRASRSTSLQDTTKEQQQLQQQEQKVVRISKADLCEVSPHETTATTTTI